MRRCWMQEKREVFVPGKSGLIITKSNRARKSQFYVIGKVNHINNK